jgi:acyl-CoA synthetase (AMP-forming)/AMP-acid ligase II
MSSSDVDEFASTPLSAGSHPSSEVASLHNAGAWVARWAMRRPHRLAWVDDHRRCSWAEAEDRVGRLTAWLAASGVVRGDRVALWLGNRNAMLEALFAAARLGAIALPINARLTATEVAFQLDDARPRALILERDWQDRARAALDRAADPPPIRLLVGAASSGTDDYETALASRPSSAHCEAVSPDAPMILMYTSGTTGKPKGALLPHRKSLYNSLNAQLFFDIRSTDRVLVVAPLFHSLGLQILALPALYAGATVVLQEGFDPRRVWTTIEREAITYFGGVPTMHRRLLEMLGTEGVGGRVPASLRFAFTAGAAAPPELIRAFHDRGLVMKQGYGQTETSILTCLEPEDALRKAGSVGRPVFHGDLRLIDPRTIEGPIQGWRDAAAGEVGEIVVRGPITMLGYWQRPEATSETLRGAWLRTGDLATRDADFDVTLVGRAREMYISGGENVYPAEIEATLVEHPEIVEAAVVALPDPEWGEVGRAYVVLVEHAAATPASIRDWLQSRLARFKQPREIVVEAELPRTASGKVQKHRLAHPTADGSA